MSIGNLDDWLRDIGHPFVGVKTAADAGTTLARIRRWSNARLMNMLRLGEPRLTLAEADSANDQVAPYRARQIALVHEMAADVGDRLGLAIEDYLNYKTTDETSALWVLFGWVPEFRIHLDPTDIVSKYYHSHEGSPERTDALRHLSATVLGALSTFDTRA